MTAMHIHKRRLIPVNAEDRFDGTRLLRQAAAAVETPVIVNVEALFTAGGWGHELVIGHW